MLLLSVLVLLPGWILLAVYTMLAQRPEISTLECAFASLSLKYCLWGTARTKGPGY